MKTSSGEAFMPGNCPALRRGDEPYADSQGFVVRPSDIEIDVESFNAEGDAVDKADSDRTRADIYAYVKLDGHMS